MVLNLSVQFAQFFDVEQADGFYVAAIVGLKEGYSI